MFFIYILNNSTQWFRVFFGCLWFYDFEQKFIYMTWKLFTN